VAQSLRRGFLQLLPGPHPPGIQCQGLRESLPRFGVVLFLIGVGCSGWFVASQISGNAALQAQQHEYLDHLSAAMKLLRW